MKNKPKLNNCGAALVMVLVIVFIIMAIISELTVTDFRTLKRLENRQNKEQAVAVLHSAIDFGRAALASSGATSNIDSLKDVWAQPLPLVKVVNQLYMRGYIIDEQSKFNVNDLVYQGIINRNILSQFIRLLRHLNLPEALAYNIAYYIATPQLQGEIMRQYTLGKPSYRPAGRPLVDISELILVKGVNPLVMNKLHRYITAIPVDNYTNESKESTLSPLNQQKADSQIGLTVNVNTASAEVIAAKSNMPLPIAQRLVSYRATKPFTSIDDISKFLASNGLMANNSSFNSNPSSNLNASNQIIINSLGINSNYFTIHAITNNNDNEFGFIAFVYRKTRVGKWPQILWEHPE